MAKLFKSISLEERWRNSIYSQGPIRPDSVEQGRIDLKPMQQPQNLPTIQLKQIPDTVERNSILLKAMIKSRPQSLPIPRPLNTKPLSSFALPFVNTKFRSAISLADRLSQPKLGSTTHLPQYFLSDAYTDYIKIVPFGVFNHTSNIILNSITFVPNQGGTNPTIVNFNSLINQGTFFSNGTYTSLVNIQTPILDSILLQGVTLVNGNYLSVSNITLPPTAGTLTTDPQVVPTNVSTTQTVEFRQGIILDSLGNLVSQIVPENVSTTQLILLAQGAKYDTQYNIVSSVILSTPNNVVQLVPSNIIITNSAVTPQQGGLDPTPINFEPVRTSPVLNVLFYEAQRALAFFTPKVIHGSANLINPRYGQTFISPKVIHGSANLINPRYGQTFILGSTNIDIDRIMERNMRIDPNLVTYVTGLKVESGKTRNWKYDTVGVKVELNGNSTYPNIESIDGVPNTSSQIAKLLGDTRDGDETLTNLSTFTETKSFDKTKVLPVKTGINAYATLAYDQIRSREKERADGKILKDFRADLPGLRGGNGQAVVIKDSTGKTVNDRGVTQGDRKYENDFVNVQIKSLRDGVITYFRAFLTSFSDSVNATWNDINYVGRQDTLKAFKGSTRAGSLGFKVAALREEDLAFNYLKLNELIKSAGVGNANSGSPNEFYVRGPLCSLTVGRWFKDTPVIFNSIKYDIQTSEYSWDIDKQMPHIVDVSLDFVVLGDIDGDPLNSGNNNYLNYRGA